MTEEKLEVICDACRRPIEDGDGFLYVELAKVRDLWSAQPDPDAQVLSIESLMGRPVRPTWQARHTACAPDDGGASYDVPVAQVRTWPGLAATTARLMGKSWLQHTDWDALLEGAASAGGSRVSRTSLREAS
ncbi:hypothetical protein FLW53_09440 [Microbispora sp. SCL1-1]|uniref:hypothetical protein n=1 Tax=unclassified Microbispora TaxID=2614687 RepID=UPI00115978E0|nr:MULTISPECIES: hypothetical protein [unclassified Microbispora]NJP24425.1 hypothetical protein [Microbispora sp. CL1-1]TQS14575.1 hypothetical protein FLW53_09440 [Microbispora sp. SCL1-1]